MPSDRPQFNVRMGPETAATVARGLPAVGRAVGAKLTQAQFFALAVAALLEKHGVEPPPPPPEMGQPRGDGTPGAARVAGPGQQTPA